MFPWFAESTCLTAKTADVEEAWTERRPVGVVVPIPTFPFSNKFRFVPTANPPVIVVVALAFPMAVNPVRVVIEGKVVVEVIQKSDEVVAQLFIVLRSTDKVPPVIESPVPVMSVR